MLIWDFQQKIHLLLNTFEKRDQKKGFSVGEVADDTGLGVEEVKAIQDR